MKLILSEKRSYSYEEIYDATWESLEASPQTPLYFKSEGKVKADMGLDIT